MLVIAGRVLISDKRLTAGGALIGGRANIQTLIQVWVVFERSRQSHPHTDHLRTGVGGERRRPVLTQTQFMPPDQSSSCRPAAGTSHRGAAPGSDRTIRPVNDCAVIAPERMFSKISSANGVSR